MKGEGKIHVIRVHVHVYRHYVKNLNRSYLWDGVYLGGDRIGISRKRFRFLYTYTCTCSSELIVIICTMLPSTIMVKEYCCIPSFLSTDIMRVHSLAIAFDWQI